MHAHSPYRNIEDVLYEMPDGRKLTYSLVHVGRVVCALALTKDEKVVLARQYRPGPDRILDELPGGGVEPSETPEAAIRRELLEETGYAAGRLVSLGTPCDCAYTTVDRHAFLALDCEKVGEPTPDGSEWIEVVLKPVPEFFAQVLAGDCTDLEVGFAGLCAAGFLKLTR